MTAGQWPLSPSVRSEWSAADVYGRVEEGDRSWA